VPSSPELVPDDRGPVVNPGPRNIQPPQATQPLQATKPSAESLTRVSMSLESHSAEHPAGTGNLAATGNRMFRARLQMDPTPPRDRTPMRITRPWYAGAPLRITRPRYAEGAGPLAENRPLRRSPTNYR